MGAVYVPGAVQEKLEPIQCVEALHEINSALFTIYSGPIIV